MNEPPIPDAEVDQPPRESPGQPALIGPADWWNRVKEHKVLQWGLAYLGAALAFAHGSDLLGHAFNWPETLNRLLLGFLIVGFPVALTLAWYHGHRGLKQISTGEMTVVSILILIGAGLLILLVRAPTEPNAESRAHAVAAEVAASPSASAPNSASLPTSGAGTVPAASVAVVPFVNLTGEPAKEFFSDGMAEELINSLSQVRGLKVPARTSSFAYKGRSVDIRRIAQDLGVATILEGSVRSAGDRVRVTAQLVDASTGFHKWSKSYDRQFGDIFKLQDDLAAAIVQALRESMNVDLPAAPARVAPTQDVEAYQLYLQAGSVQNGSEESFHRSLALFDQAIARDPKFARALAGRAWARATFVTFGFPLPHALEGAEQDAARALELDPNQPTAHSVLGITNALRGRWVSAEMNFHAAIAADPNDAGILATHSITVLAPAGRLRQWHAEALEAYRLAPADGLTVINLALAQSDSGNDQDAENSAALALELKMAPPLAATIYKNSALHQGRYADVAKNVIETMPGGLRAAGGAEVVGLTYAALTDPEKKPAALRALRTFEARIGALESGNQLLVIYTQLGAIDDAYASVNRFLDASRPAGVVGDIWDLWGPEMAPFRRDPRFHALATRLGFMDYWKRYGPPDVCDLTGDTLTCH
jgi:TolB-like protein/tetratricopeptide (TPR) repeat protein